MRGHKGAVHDVSVHPSGRLAPGRRRPQADAVEPADGQVQLHARAARRVPPRALDACRRRVRARAAARGDHRPRVGELRHALPHDGGAPLARLRRRRPPRPGGDDATPGVWDVERGARVRAAARARAANQGARRARRRARRRRRVASASSDGTIRVWRACRRRRRRSRARPRRARSSCSSRSRRSSAHVPHRAPRRRRRRRRRCRGGAVPTRTPTRARTAAPPRRPPPPRRPRGRRRAFSRRSAPRCRRRVRVREEEGKRKAASR